MLSRKKLGGFAAILMLLVASVYFYRGTISLPPSHIHAWTQSDRYAIAIGFTENGLNLFKPQTYNLQTKEGVTAVDFPMPDYLAAATMKICGSQQPIIFRLTVLLLCISMLLLFIRFVATYSGSAFKGLGMGLFVFSLPVLVYFQAGFIPSPVAFYLSLGGLYFYYKYLHCKYSKHFAAALAMFTLAALIRAPFFLFLLGFIGTHALYGLRNKVFNLRDIFLYTASITMVIAYFCYNQYLRNQYGSMFLTQLMYATSFADLKYLVKMVWQRWHYQYFTLAHYCFLAVVSRAFVVGYLRRQIQLSKADKQLALVALIFWLSAMAYALLMAKQFVDHEYYFIDSFYLPIVLFATFFLAKTKYSKGMAPMAILLTVLLITGCYQSKQVQQTKYSYADWDMGEVTRKNFTGADVFLDSIGVPRSAKILVIDAYSTNAPLLQAGRKGYTVLSTYYQSIDSALTLPFDYVLIQDRSILSDVLNYYPPLGTKLRRIAGNGRVSVYIKDSTGHNNLWQLTGIDKRSIIDSSTAIMGSGEQKTDSAYIYYMQAQNKYSPGYEAAYNGQYNALLFMAKFVAGATGQVQVALQVEGPNGYSYYKAETVALLPENLEHTQQILLKLPGNMPPNSIVKCFIVNSLNKDFAYKNGIVYLLKQ